MKFILLFILLAASIKAQTFEEYKSFLTKYEGYENYSYKDANGYSVGIGHYLGEKSKKGIYYNDKQIANFFKKDLEIAISIARKYVKNFDKLDKNRKLVIISCAYNLGETRFSQFKRFIRAINSNNYKLAANELKDSKWYYQVKNRGVDHYNRIKNG